MTSMIESYYWDNLIYQNVVKNHYNDLKILHKRKNLQMVK
jgi:hypothetical protein